MSTHQLLGYIQYLLSFLIVVIELMYDDVTRIVWTFRHEMRIVCDSRIFHDKIEKDGDDDGGDDGR
jgi:hypothetical protein